MKNLVCPISTERINESTPRLIGLLVVILLVNYIIFDIWLIPALLIIDFYIRGFRKSQYSPLAQLSSKLNKRISLKGKQIDKAPKQFAARLGFVFTIIILVSHWFNLSTVSTSIALAVIVFATLECVANFCVGCLVFTWFVKPYLR